MKDACTRLLSLTWIVALAFINVPLQADTVVLQNGARIDGQVIDNRDTTGEVIIRFGELGYTKLRSGQVAEIIRTGEASPVEATSTKDSTTVLTAAPASSEEPQAGDWVTIRLPSSADSLYGGIRVPEGATAFGDGSRGTVSVDVRDTADGKEVVRTVVSETPEGSKVVTHQSGAYTSGTYQGVLSDESDDETIVLEIPDAGKIRIPKVEGLVMVRSDPPQAPEADAGEARTIKTTHVVQLKNGRKLKGNLVPTAESEPVKLRIGQLGVMTLRRNSIAPDGIQAVDGVIELPEQPEEPAPPVRPVLPDPVRQDIKEEIREEVLRDLIDRKIDEAIDSMFERPGVRSFGMVDDPTYGLSAEEAQRISDQVWELTRQRNTNRVRAEADLKRIGSAALPFLESVATHPFDLTRRAVQRIVGDVGDLRGAPLAIGALNDPDVFVRRLAGENVKDLMGGTVRYNPAWGEKLRLEAQDEYWHVWDELIYNRAREKVLTRIALSK